MIPNPGGVPSPCIQVCRIHEATGWCIGCKRTLDEIAAWSTMSDDDKRRVWQALAERPAPIDAIDAPPPPPSR